MLRRLAPLALLILAACGDGAPTREECEALGPEITACVDAMCDAGDTMCRSSAQIECSNQLGFWACRIEAIEADPGEPIADCIDLAIARRRLAGTPGGIGPGVSEYDACIAMCDASSMHPDC
ncbi:MAG: hypothetical protein RMA76_38070 [Deltaproteobacteria bacterium]|jgi:hypothetical protein